MAQKPEIDSTEARKGKIYLWLAILIFGAAAAVVAKLIMIGENVLLDGRNPISFCNLLFAGNVIAGLTLLVIFHRDWCPSELKKLTPKQWLIQLVLAVTSGALAPSLMFQAIEQTSVTNVDGVVWKRGCRWRPALLVFGDQTGNASRYFISLRIFTDRWSHLRIPDTR